MRKLLYFFLFIVIAIVSLLLWYDQSKNYYCLSEDKCITVWKRLGGDCYIISGKYSGWFSPSNDYVKTSNTQYLTLYYSNKLPDNVIIRNQGTSGGLEGGYEITGDTFVKYTDELKELLYRKNATYHKDIKEGVGFIDLDIKESYAKDNYGTKLK